MGKFSNSDIHNKYSDWHYGIIQLDDKYRRLYVTDIDRLWIEYDYRNDFIWVIDIKYEGSGDVLTPTEEKVRDWFVKHGAQFFTVYITRDFTSFRVINSQNKERNMKSMEYADWLLSLRSSVNNNGFHEHEEVIIQNNQSMVGSQVDFDFTFTEEIEEIPY